jgi:hypothetical protein
MTTVPDKPESSLAAALARMSFTVEAERYVLIGFAEPPLAADVANLDAPPAQIVRERDETTLLVRASCADAILARHPDARCERGLAWIRFATPMSWDLVGFLAHVASQLAAAGVPIGAVCGFSRDHLFVAEQHLPRARDVLARMFPEHPADT